MGPVTRRKERRSFLKGIFLDGAPSGRFLREQSLEKRDETDKRSINVHLGPEVYGSYRWSVSPTSFRFAGSIPPCIMASARPEPIIAYPSLEGEIRIVVFYLGRIATAARDSITDVFVHIHIHVRGRLYISRLYFEKLIAVETSACGEKLAGKL